VAEDRGLLLPLQAVMVAGSSRCSPFSLLLQTVCTSLEVQGLGAAQATIASAATSKLMHQHRHQGMARAEACLPLQLAAWVLTFLASTLSTHVHDTHIHRSLVLHQTYNSMLPDTDYLGLPSIVWFVLRAGCVA
jgi:hypothetical protein